jgi:hypothetical protein
LCKRWSDLRNGLSRGSRWDDLLNSLDRISEP